MWASVVADEFVVGYGPRIMCKRVRNLPDIRIIPNVTAP